MALTKYSDQGYPLTTAQLDANWTYFNNSKVVSVKDYGAVGDGVTDDTVAIQAAITAAELASSSEALPQPIIHFFGDHTYCITAQIVCNSDLNTKLLGVGGKPTIKYTGSTMNTGTQDNSTGAMILFSGADHAFGGIENFFINCNSKANFGVYWAGSWNIGFKLKYLHLKFAQLDCLRHINTGTSGPVLAAIESCSFFPATGATFSGVPAVCGRYPINLDINSSTGQLKLVDLSTDSGASGVIKVTATTYAGMDLILDNVRFETYGTNTDCLIVDYGSATSLGNILFSGCKSAQGDGTLRSWVRNATVSGVRPIITIDRFSSNDSMTDVYTHVADTTKSLVYHNKINGSQLSINKVANVELLPISTAWPTTPLGGMHYWDSASGEYHIHDGTNDNKFKAEGKGSREAKTSGPVTVALTDAGKTFTNNGAAGSITFSLPAVSTLPADTAVFYRFITTYAQAIVVTPNAADDINYGGAGVSLTSTAAQNNVLGIVSASGDGWVVIERQGTWA